MEVNIIMFECVYICVLNREQQTKLREHLCPRNARVEKDMNTPPFTVAEVSAIQIFSRQQYFSKNRKGRHMPHELCYRRRGLFVLLERWRAVDMGLV